MASPPPPSSQRLWLRLFLCFSCWSMLFSPLLGQYIVENIENRSFGDIFDFPGPRVVFQSFLIPGVVGHLFNLTSIRVIMLPDDSSTVTLRSFLYNSTVTDTLDLHGGAFGDLVGEPAETVTFASGNANSLQAVTFNFTGGRILTSGDSFFFNIYMSGGNGARMLGCMESPTYDDGKYQQHGGSGSQLLDLCFRISAYDLCGDGVLQDSEDCDGGLGCSSSCVCEGGYEPDPLSLQCRAICGNGIVDNGEQCDFAGANCGSECVCDSALYEPEPDPDVGCRLICGNGVLDAGEECDDAGPFCAPTCFCQSDSYEPEPAPEDVGCRLVCGNGVLDDGEDCDAAHPNCGSGCVCVAEYEPIYSGEQSGCYPLCGNGKYEMETEDCDFVIDEDLCNTECECHEQAESDGTGKCQLLCGNGNYDLGEECDSTRPDCSPECECQGAMSGDGFGGCTANCGNGVIDDSEGCDGGLNCLSTCQCQEAFVLDPSGLTEDCTPLCGNGVTDPEFEMCDGGLNCTPNCTCPTETEPDMSDGCQPLCGNTRLNPMFEECDSSDTDSALNAPDGYVNFCLDSCECPDEMEMDEYSGCRFVCGNGIHDEGEQCDPAIPHSNCSELCECSSEFFEPFGNGTCTSKCGNGVFDEGLEDCEFLLVPDCLHSCICEPNRVAEAGDCVPFCGNMELDLDEECDGGIGCTDCLCGEMDEPSPSSDPPGCVSRCGNTVKEEEIGEECDSGYDCLPDCQCPLHMVPKSFFEAPVNQREGCVGYCSNGVLETDLGEACERVTYVDEVEVVDELCGSDTCDCVEGAEIFEGLCRLICGNGILNIGEACDGGPACEDNCSCPSWAVPTADNLGCVGYCGNFILEEGEECDGGTDCRQNCECPDKMVVDDNAGCKLACGDGIVSEVFGEECDSVGKNCEGCRCPQFFVPDGEGDCDDARIHCVHSDWTLFGNCSLVNDTCIRTQYRTILTPSDNGGDECGELSADEDCDPELCITRCPCELNHIECLSPIDIFTVPHVCTCVDQHSVCVSDAELSGDSQCVEPALQEGCAIFGGLCGGCVETAVSSQDLVNVLNVFHDDLVMYLLSELGQVTDAEFERKYSPEPEGITLQGTIEFEGDEQLLKDAAVVAVANFFGMASDFVSIELSESSTKRAVRDVSFIVTPSGSTANEINSNGDEILGLSSWLFFVIVAIVAVVLIAFVGVMLFFFVFRKSGDVGSRTKVKVRSADADGYGFLMNAEDVNGKDWKHNGSLYHRELKPGMKEHEFFFDHLKTILDGKLLSESVKKVHQIKNTNLIEMFDLQANKMRNRLVENPDLFAKDTWKKVDDGRIDQRQFTLDMHQGRIDRLPWKSDPVLPGLTLVHGTDSSVAWSIAQNGFTTVSSLDDGFYGNGMYFSTSAVYTFPYYATKKNPSLLVCLSVLGNPYPVVEAQKEADSHRGKPLKSGYQSNVVMTQINGEPVTTKDKACFDEYVLAQESQVVPVFIVELDKAGILPLSQNYQRLTPDPNAQDNVVKSPSQSYLSDHDRSREEEMAVLGSGSDSSSSIESSSLSESEPLKESETSDGSS